MCELAFGAGLIEELIEFPELEVQVGRVLLLGLQLQVELEDVLGDLLFFSEGEVVIETVSNGCGFDLELCLLDLCLVYLISDPLVLAPPTRTVP